MAFGTERKLRDRYRHLGYEAMDAQAECYIADNSFIEALYATKHVPRAQQAAAWANLIKVTTKLPVWNGWVYGR
jgi:hypothetical protein